MEPSSVEKYIAHETPEQKANRMRKRLETLQLKKNNKKLHDGKGFSGYRINIASLQKGCYVKHSSRTILMPNPSLKLDDFTNTIVAHLRIIRKNSGSNRHDTRIVV